VWNAFCAAALVNCLHKAGIVPEDERKNKIESESDAGVMQNWQHLCQKLEVMLR
jgi:hypothetical protein